MNPCCDDWFFCLRDLEMNMFCLTCRSNIPCILYQEVYLLIEFAAPVSLYLHYRTECPDRQLSGLQNTIIFHAKMFFLWMLVSCRLLQSSIILQKLLVCCSAEYSKDCQKHHEGKCSLWLKLIEWEETWKHKQVRLLLHKDYSPHLEKTHNIGVLYS